MYEKKALRRENINREFGVSTVIINNDFPLHWHTFYEVEFIYSGSSTQVINGYRYYQSPGFLSILSPHDFHRIEPDVGDCLQCKKFAFSDTFISSRLSTILNERKHPCVIQIPLEQQKQFHDLFDAMVDIYKSHMESPLKKLALQNNAEAVLIRALLLDSNDQASYLQENVHRVQRDNTMHQIIKYISNNYSSPIKLSDVANVLCQSESYFSHYFKKAFGLSFSDYLKHYRLKIATNLLTSAERSISEISVASGFSSVTFFNRAFKEVYNCTPSQFRQQAVYYIQQSIR